MKKLIQTSTRERHEKEETENMALRDLDNFVENEMTMDTICLETLSTG